MSKNGKNRQLTYVPVCVTIPPRAQRQLAEFVEKIEARNHLQIGVSFAVRIAIEELMNRKDAEDKIVGRKIDTLKAQVNA